MEIISHYQEAHLQLGVDKTADLYVIHQQVMAVTDGNKAISYAPVGPDKSGNIVVRLRSAPGVMLPDGLTVDQKTLAEGETFSVYARIRLVRRSDFGERMPTVNESMGKWITLLSDNGFEVEEGARIAETATSFYHKRLSQQTRLPYWVVTSVLKVTDPEKAAQIMVRGIGRSRGLGFGMLMRT